MPTARLAAEIALGVGSPNSSNLQPRFSALQRRSRLRNFARVATMRSLMRGSVSRRKSQETAPPQQAPSPQPASPAPTAPSASSAAPWTRTTQRTPAQQRELASQQRQPDFSLSRGGTLSSLKRAGTAAALSRSNTLTFSKAEKFGSDRTPDTHADIQNDAANDAVDPASIQFHDPESAAARFTVDEDDGDLSSDLDPTEVAEAMAHRKRTQVGKLLKGKRRASSSSTALTPYSGDTPGAGPSGGGDGGGKAVGAPRQLTSLGVEARLLRDVDEPDRVWTMGRHTMGQGGHTIERPGHEPFPAALDGGLLKGGVRSAHAGGLSTLVVNGVGEVIGFGAGPWRGAIDEEGGDITGRGGDGSWGDGESSLAYVGAPPFRVPQPPPPPPTAVDEDGDGEAEMDPEWLANGMMTRVRIGDASWTQRASHTRPAHSSHPIASRYRSPTRAPSSSYPWRSSSSPSRCPSSYRP